MAEWTFVTNHALVLNYIAKHNDTTAREIAAALGVTERTVHKIIADLEQGGYIRKHREGRRNVYAVNHDQMMRHETLREIAVGDLLHALTPTQVAELADRVSARR